MLKLKFCLFLGKRKKKNLKESSEEDDEEDEEYKEEPMETDEEDFQPAIRSSKNNTTKRKYTKRNKTVVNNTKKRTCEKQNYTETDSDDSASKIKRKSKQGLKVKINKIDLSKYRRQIDNKNTEISCKQTGNLDTDSDEIEWVSSSVSPTLGNKRPRYAKDGVKVESMVGGRKRKRNYFSSATEDDEDVMVAKRVTTSRSDRSLRLASRSRRGNNYEVLNNCAYFTRLLLQLYISVCYNLCYKFLLILHYNKCYMLQLCYNLLLILH